MVCSCGNKKAHEISRRRTYDGTIITLWSDGSVYGPMGIGVYGACPRNPGLTESYVRAGWLALGEVELYESCEVKRLVREARRAMEQVSMTPLAYLRARMTGRRIKVGGRGAVIKLETA